MTPNGEFFSNIGTFRYVLTNATHVSIRGEPTVRGVSYNVHVHLYFRENKWALTYVHDLYVARVDGKQREPSDSAKKMIMGAVRVEWDRTCNAEMQAVAQRHHNRQEIAKRVEKIIEHKNDIKSLQEEIKGLEENGEKVTNV